VHVVDENDVPYRGVYELIRSSDQQPYVVGFGADTLEGERLMTLLVHEDLYRMVRQGSNYRARTDFSTVLVPPGALVHYKLVIDTDTGEFRGSGVMAPRELGLVTEENPLNIRWSVGASLPFAKSENVVGANNQTSSGLDVFFDNYISYQRGDNYFSNILEVEGGFSKIDPEGQPTLPLTKTRDRLRVDTFYTRFVLPRFGPYARFGLLTNMFESNTLFTEDSNAIRIFKDGTTQEEFVPANTHFRTGDSFAPVNLRQGAGANVRLIQNRIFILDVRAGVGFRQFLINDSFFLDDDPATEALEYVQLENFNRSGLETTVVGTLRFRRLVMNTDLDPSATSTSGGATSTGATASAGDSPGGSRWTIGTTS
jgi:hypothetical protein